MVKQTINIDEPTYSPGFLPGGHSTFNRYATTKTLANSSFEIALLITNAVQLKTLLTNGVNHDALWYVGLTLVCISLFIQVINACILVLLGKDDISKEQKQHRLVSLNNFSLILSVLLAIVNVVLNVIVVIEPKILVPTMNGTKYA
jgi:uncharacterized membrane protein YvlD (DUF360 family)